MTDIQGRLNTLWALPESDRQKGVNLLSKIFANILESPQNTKFHDLNFSKIRKKLDKCRPCLYILFLAGFSQSVDGSRLQFQPTRFTEKSLRTINEALVNKINGIEYVPKEAQVFMPDDQRRANKKPKSPPKKKPSANTNANTNADTNDSKSQSISHTSTNTTTNTNTNTNTDIDTEASNANASALALRRQKMLAQSEQNAAAVDYSQMVDPEDEVEHAADTQMTDPTTTTADADADADADGDAELRRAMQMSIDENNDGSTDTGAGAEADVSHISMNVDMNDGSTMDPEAMMKLLMKAAAQANIPMADIASISTGANPAPAAATELSDADRDLIQQIRAHKGNTVQLKMSALQGLTKEEKLKVVAQKQSEFRSEKAQNQVKSRLLKERNRREGLQQAQEAKRKREEYQRKALADRKAREKVAAKERKRRIREKIANEKVRKKASREREKQARLKAQAEAQPK